MQADDYLECLHRTNEVRHHLLIVLSPVKFQSLAQIARAKAVATEFAKKAQKSAHEGRKAADILADGVIVGVGLIQRDQNQTSH